MVEPIQIFNLHTGQHKKISQNEQIKPQIEKAPRADSLRPSGAFSFLISQDDALVPIHLRHRGSSVHRSMHFPLSLLGVQNQWPTDGTLDLSNDLSQIRQPVTATCMHPLPPSHGEFGIITIPTLSHLWQFSTIEL